MSYKPIDNKRDQFRQYIESNGVIEMLSKVFIELLESNEKPEHPIDYIRKNLGASLQESNEIDFLKDELGTLRRENDDLKKQVNELRKQLELNIDNLNINKSYEDSDINTTNNTSVVSTITEANNDSLVDEAVVAATGGDKTNNSYVEKNENVNNPDSVSGSGVGSTVDAGIGSVQVQEISSASDATAKTGVVSEDGRPAALPVVDEQKVVN